MMFDRGLYEYTKNWVFERHGVPPIAYRIKEDGTEIPIEMGIYEMTESGDFIHLTYVQSDGSKSHTMTIPKREFTLEYMLKRTEQRDSNSAVSHMLSEPITQYRSMYRNNSIDSILSDDLLN